VLTPEEIDQLASLVRGVIREELDARGIKKIPNDITEKRRAAALVRWAAKRAADKQQDADACKSNANVSAGKPRKQRASQANAMQVHNGVEAWNAYSSAYQDRYGVAPVRNAKVNSMLAKFVQRVPLGEAPEIAAFYVSHNQSFYIRAKHDVAFLLRDAEGLRTEWVTGRRVTDTEAKQVDATAARGSVWGKLIEESKHEH
jgi:hypothetical protein